MLCTHQDISQVTPSDRHEKQVSLALMMSLEPTHWEVLQLTDQLQQPSTAARRCFLKVSGCKACKAMSVHVDSYSARTVRHREWLGESETVGVGSPAPGEKEVCAGD